MTGKELKLLTEVGEVSSVERVDADETETDGMLVVREKALVTVEGAVEVN